MRRAALKVGDSVWLAYRDGSGEYAEVTSIGRRWVYLHRNLRFDKHTWRIDNGPYVADVKVYASQEEWLAHTRCAMLWANIRRMVNENKTLPKDLADERDLLLVSKLLGLEITV